MASRRACSSPSVVVGVTVGISAKSLLRGQLAWFRDAGWDVTLVSAPDQHAREAALRERVPLVGIPMRRQPSPVADLVSLIRWIRLLVASRPDAVSVGTPKAALLGTLAAWLTRIPRRLYVVRGLRLEGTTAPLSWMLWLVEVLTMRLATDVLFISSSMADEARRRRLVPPDKAWLIGAGSSNGVDAVAVAKRVAEVDASTLRADLGIGPKAFVVGFIGRINRDKGVDLLFEALQSPDLDPSAQALIVGPTEDAHLERNIQTCEKRIKRVQWTDDVWGHLSVMDVLCLPTRREGFANVVLEAAAACVPAIVTNATGVIDTVLPGITGLVLKNRDAGSLVVALNEAASKREWLRELGESARRRVLIDYIPERVWLGIEEILTGAPKPVEARKVPPPDAVFAAQETQFARGHVEDCEPRHRRVDRRRSSATSRRV